MRCYLCDEAEVAVVAAWLCARCAGAPALIRAFAHDLRRAFPHHDPERFVFQPREGFAHLRPRLTARQRGDEHPPSGRGDDAWPDSPMPMPETGP